MDILGDADYLIPFVPAGHGLSDRSEYLEISTHGREIADGLDYIKNNMTPPTELLKMIPSPRPAKATLPAGWQDNEVSLLLDAFHQQEAVIPPSTNTSGFGEGHLPLPPRSFHKVSPTTLTMKTPVGSTITSAVMGDASYPSQSGAQ